MAGSVQATGLFDDERPRAPEPGPVEALRKVDRFLARVEEVGLALALFGLVGVAVYQVACRHWFPPSPYWAGEVVKYAVFFIGMVGGALAAQSERLFNIDMFTRLFSPRGRLVIRVLSALLTIFVCYMFIRSGWRLRGQVLEEHGEVIAPATGLLVLPIGAALIGAHMAVHAAIDLYYLMTGKASPDVNTGPVA